MFHENVTIGQINFGPGKRGVYAINVVGEGWFTKADGTPRTFKTSSGAVSFLRRACKSYPELEYTVTMPDGKVKEIGAGELDASKFGPHNWSKKNAVTIMKGGSSYDVYECRYCRKQEKTHGLSGHRVQSGVCEKNPLEVK